MSNWVSPGSSMAGYDQQALEEERAGLSTQPGRQEPWYAPNFHSRYVGMTPYSIPNVTPYTQRLAQNATTRVRWDTSDPFDEDEQERRKKGKEVIRPVPPPWGYYSGYGPESYYAPVGYPVVPTLPQPHHFPVSALPFPGSSGNAWRKPTRNVAPHDQLSGTRQRSGSRSAKSRIIRGGTGIQTPDSDDMTIHLTMDLEEDLEDSLDELNRLSRLGHFSAAQKFFHEHLYHHLDNPYVLVQYADLLLRQGDFKGVTLLKDDAMYKNEAEDSVSEELRILRVNWELIQTVAKSKTLDTLTGVPAVFEEAATVITAMAGGFPPDSPISSTEIQIFTLALHLTAYPALRSKWDRNGARGMDAFFAAVGKPSLSRLHETLLRQGRIWDFHDCVVLSGTIEDIRDVTRTIFGKDLIPSLKLMVTQWSESIHGYDASTTLGLLSIMTHIMLEPVQASEKECIEVLKLCLPLAISVAENDPDSLKSRPYLRVLLAKSRFAEKASRQTISTLSDQLQSVQGVFYNPDVALLPMYVPSGNEILQWTLTDHPHEVRDPVKLVLRSVLDLGDMGTEVLTRRELIRLSNSPKDEFDMLCALQLDRQGDLNGYGLSLASKYIVLSTKEAKEELAVSISRLLSRVASTDCWDPSIEWILNMLLYKLEGRSPSSIKQMLERSHVNYHSMAESLLRDISRQIPILKDWVEQQTRDPVQNSRRIPMSRANLGIIRHRRSGTKRAKSPGASRTVQQPSVRAQRSSKDGDEERDTPLSPRSEHEDRQEDQETIPENASPYVQPLGNEQLGTINEPRNSQETPVITVARRNDAHHNHHASLHANAPRGTDLPEKIKRREEAQLEVDIRKRLAAEYDKKLAAEIYSKEKRRQERMAIFDELKKQVEAIRKEAVAHAERKARVEAQERHEQLAWERRLQKSEQVKELAMEKANAAEAEMDAKFEAEREMAIREAERKIKEEREIRKKKEEEARQTAANALHQKIEAERKALVEAEAERKYKEEVDRKIAAEKREEEERARDAARRQAEEETTRRWATEQAQRDVEAQNQIHFRDAIGRKFTIPFSEGRKWQTMRELIEAPFAHIDVLGPEVRVGHYDLVGPDGSIILPQTWDSIIQPGWQIKMEMWPMVAGPPAVPQPWEPAPDAGGVPPLPGPPVPSANEGVTIVAPEEQGQDSSEPIHPDDDDDEEEEEEEEGISSGYGSDLGPRRRTPRKRIAHAFAALKASVFRRRRRRSSVTTLSTGSSLGAFDD